MLTTVGSDQSNEAPSVAANPQSVADAVNNLAAIMHRVESQEVLPSVLLVLTPASEVCLEGMSVKALQCLGNFLATDGECVG